MDNFKCDFQFIMRRLYCLLPVDLAHDSIGDILFNLSESAYIDLHELSYLMKLNNAYSDFLGGYHFEG